MTEKTFTELKYYQGIRLRIYPSTPQKRVIDTNINGSRFAYNKIVALNKRLADLKRVKIYIKVVADEIEYIEKLLYDRPTQQIFNKHRWLMEYGVKTDTVDHAIRAYQSAWNLYRKVGNHKPPNFHKKSSGGSFRLSNRYPKKLRPNGEARSLFNGLVRFLDKDYMQVPYIGRIRVSGSHRHLFALKGVQIGTVMISRSAVGSYYISFQIGSDKPFVEPLNKKGSQIGIDLNTENFLTTSDGEVIDNPRYYRTIKGRLAKAQRKLSRRKLRAEKEHRNLNDSKNYQKQRQLVASLHEKVKNQRKNFLNTQSTALINNHDLVVAEELRSSNMLRNHRLAMSISDVGWRTFLTMLEWKAKRYGRRFVVVDPRNTTQTCSKCDYVLQKGEKLTLKNREWTCPNCNTFHVRDHNAAKNILKKGIKNL